MSEKENRFSGSRQRSSGTGFFESDEFLYGITHGAYELPRRDSSCDRNNWSGERATFEQTYPKYSFAELVRLAIGFGGWLAGRLRRRPASSGVAHSEDGALKASAAAIVKAASRPGR